MKQRADSTNTLNSSRRRWTHSSCCCSSKISGKRSRQASGDASRNASQKLEDLSEAAETRPDGATRRDRTGDLLITKFCFLPYAIDSTVGLNLETSAYSAQPALIESDFESNFDRAS
jgi:hypothetical protein